MLTALLVVAALLQAPPPKPTEAEAERAKAVVTEIETAFGRADAGPKLRAIEGAASVPGPSVARALARGLADPDAAVRRAAIEALRFHPDPRSFDELLARAKTKAAKDDASSYAPLLRALGQKGDARAIDVLSENPWSAPDAQVIQARILGLGRIRTKESVEALTGLLQVAGPHKTQPFLKDFRLALWSLTGADQGESQELWLRWLRENKGRLQVLATPPDEPRELTRRWAAYWGEPARDSEEREGRERGKKDERRGG